MLTLLKPLRRSQEHPSHERVELRSRGRRGSHELDVAVPFHEHPVERAGVQMDVEGAAAVPSRDRPRGSERAGHLQIGPFPRAADGTVDEQALAAMVGRVIDRD